MALEETHNKSEEIVNSTNQLEFIKKDVLPDLKVHRFSWPFRSPVDVVALNIPVSFKELYTF